MKFTGVKDVGLQVLTSHLHQVLLQRLIRNVDPKIAEQAERVAEMLSSVEVHFSSRLRTTAGLAWYGDQPKIELHHGLLAHDLESYEQTYAHELGHLIAAVLFEDRKHGLGWKATMAYLEASAEVKHGLDVRPWSRIDKSRQAA